MIPPLASLILLEGGVLIMSAGIIKGIFGMIPPVDIIMISFIGLCIGWIGFDSGIRNYQVGEQDET